MSPEAGIISVPVLPSSELLYWLLLAGHLLGDFLFRADRDLTGTGPAHSLLAHGVAVLVLPLVAVAPLLNATLAAAILAITVTHVVIDFVTRQVDRGQPMRLRPFVLDQAVHLIVLCTAAAVVSRVAPVEPHFSPFQLGVWSTVVVTAGVLAFTWNGGSAIVSSTLLELQPGLEEKEDRGDRDNDGVPGSGRLIGILERTIALILILLGQWAAIVLLLAAKSIARFEALKNRRFAEYYLAGTLTSVLVAIVAGLVLTVFLRGW